MDIYKQFTCDQHNGFDMSLVCLDDQCNAQLICGNYSLNYKAICRDLNHQQHQIVSVEMVEEMINYNNSTYVYHPHNGLLDLAQFEIQKMKLQVKEFNLKNLLVECLDLFQDQAEIQQVDLLLNCENNVPVVIINDPIKIKQIIINLIGSALKFTCSSYINIWVSKEKGLIKIECSDKGGGITDEDKIKIENAYRFGVGPALMISNMIAKNLSKEKLGLQIESQYENITSFKFYLSINMSDQIEDQDAINEQSQKIQQYIIDIK